MKSLKAILCVIVCALMATTCFVFAACNNTNGPNKDPTNKDDWIDNILLDDYFDDDNSNVTMITKTQSDGVSIIFGCNEKNVTDTL